MVRYQKEGKDGSGGQKDYEHNVFVATDLSLKGKKILKTYDLRSEIEEDHRQWKDGLWEMTEFTSRDIVQIEVYPKSWTCLTCVYCVPRNYQQCHNSDSASFI